jgi:hypothetical protein
MLPGSKRSTALSCREVRAIAAVGDRHRYRGGNPRRETKAAAAAYHQLVMAEWSLTRIEAMAPDAPAMATARGLARTKKWPTLGRSETSVWGECQGSGSTPYQVRVALEDGAYKCSCPSRKQPCKHTLALLLLLASGAVPEGTPPPFVEEWVASRAQRAARATKSPRTAPADPRVQAQRIERRESRIETGLQQLETWMDDLVSQGLAAARAQPAAFWDGMAARLVDAQAPGLARRVRTLGALAAGSHDWQSRLLAALARLRLLVEAYRASDRLPAELVHEVRTQAGWTQNQDALLARDAPVLAWGVVGVRRSGDEQLTSQASWLIATSGEPALVLEFAHGDAPLGTALEPGQAFEGQLVFFDGVPPLRALIKSQGQALPRVTRLPEPVDVVALQARIGGLLGLNPFIERWPVVLGPVVAQMTGGRCTLVDGRGSRLATVPWFRHGWHLTALTRAEPVTLFGEWTMDGFDPVTVEAHGALFGFSWHGASAILRETAA